MMNAERLATYFHMDESTQPQEVVGLKDKGLDAEEDAESGPDHVTEEDDGSDDDTTASFREMTITESFFRSRSCTVCTIVALSILGVASLVALITVAVLVASPYQKAAGFHLTTCQVTISTQDENDKICSCGKGCSAEFSCLHILVRYKNFRDAVFEEKLFDNEATLHKECSYFPPCRSSRSANQEAVKGYEHDYGQPGVSYPCLYNPDNPQEVIRTRRFQLQHVIHGLLWSSVVFVLSVCLLVMAVKRRGCEFL